MAIAEYAYRYTQAYNYDNSDSMSDYFDVNFYGTCSAHSIVHWNYEQTEMTDEYEGGFREGRSRTAGARISGTQEAV